MAFFMEIAVFYDNSAELFFVIFLNIKLTSTQKWNFLFKVAFLLKNIGISDYVGRIKMIASGDSPLFNWSKCVPSLPRYEKT